MRTLTVAETATLRLAANHLHHAYDHLVEAQRLVDTVFVGGCDEPAQPHYSDQTGAKQFTALVHTDEYECWTGSEYFTDTLLGCAQQWRRYLDTPPPPFLTYGDKKL